MKDPIYEEIVSTTNLAEAYFEIGEKFILEGKSGYSGLDGLQIQEFDTNLEKNLQEIRADLITLAPLMPLNCSQIPKKNGKLRDIYILSLHDRIKSQAIIRVLEPLLEKVYSPFLFSYRSTHPTHLAARSAVRRYHRYFGKDYILLTDVEKYFDNIDKKIIINKLEKFGLQSATLSLIQLFLDQKILRNNKLLSLDRGLMQGVPLAVSLANFYLNEIDWLIGKKVSFYRRVSDDILIMDKSEHKVLEIYDLLQIELDKLGLNMHPTKTKLMKNSELFEYLGYLFHNNKVAIATRSQEKLIAKLEAELHYYPIALDKKIERLRQKIFTGADSISAYLQNTIRHYRFVDDYDQIKEVSEKIYHILTRYFFKTYTARHRRRTKNICRDLGMPSFYKMFVKYHHE
ncbi:MAG: reverse transcriptase domain-containing protein [Candidatus Komeilibacteria bacterium]